MNHSSPAAGTIEILLLFLQSTVLLKKRRQTEPLSLPSVSGASKLHVEGKMTLQISGCSDHRIVLNHNDSQYPTKTVPLHIALINEPVFISGTRTLPRQRKTVGAIGFGHIDSIVAATEDEGNEENKEFLASSPNSHNLPYV